MQLPPTSTRTKSLIRRAQLGTDSSALDDLATKYWGLVVAWAGKWGIATSDAEDIAQNVFLRILPKLSTYDETKGRFRTWLGTATRNSANNFLRHQNRAKTLNGIAFDPKSLEQLVTAVSDANWSEEKMSETKSAAALFLDEAQNQFSDEDWYCFSEMVGKDTTSSEIARELSISSDSVRKKKKTGLSQTD